MFEIRHQRISLCAESKGVADSCFIGRRGYNFETENKIPVVGSYIGEWRIHEKTPSTISYVMRECGGYWER